MSARCLAAFIPGRKRLYLDETTLRESDRARPEGGACPFLSYTRISTLFSKSHCTLAPELTNCATQDNSSLSLSLVLLFARKGFAYLTHRAPEKRSLRTDYEKLLKLQKTLFGARPFFSKHFTRYICIGLLF